MRVTPASLEAVATFYDMLETVPPPQGADFEGNPLTSDPVRYARMANVLAVVSVDRSGMADGRLDLCGVSPHASI